MVGITIWNFYFRLFPGSIKAPQVIEFLQHLQRHIRSRMIIIWDGLAVHRSALMREFVTAQRGRLQLEFLPAYAPELNPVGYIWVIASSTNCPISAQRTLVNSGRVRPQRPGPDASPPCPDAIFLETSGIILALASLYYAMLNKMNKMISANQISRRAFVLLLLLLVSNVGCGKKEADVSHDRSGKPISVVTALGRITPGRAVISVAAEPGSRVLKLEVTEGQKVKAGDVLAYLDAYPLRLAERDAAKVAREETWERNETETAYAHGVVDQNTEAVQLLEVAVDHERKELARTESMFSTHTVQKKQLDDQKYLLKSREAELAKAKAELRSAEAGLARIRSTVGLRSAEARLKPAEAQLELAIIRAPIDGEILKVHTYPGERIGNDPILRMGNKSDMHVIAEVHETDVRHVRVGQSATITSEALAEPVHGVVEEIGALIFKNDVLDLDPRAPRDTRTVEVRIKLDKSEAVSHFSHLEVSTRIDVNAPPPGVKSAAR